MERWAGKVAVVTGASAGIGYAVLERLAAKGMIAVGLARRDDKIKALAEKSAGTIHAVKCDVSDEADIIRAFNWIEETLGGVDLLVNNAGVMDLISLFGPNSSAARIKSLLDLNVVGLTICTREALKTMRKRGDNGHIIHMNSTAGHQVIPLINCGIYSASKHAVTALSKSLRLELELAKSKIKVTSVCPGLVYTDMTRSTVKDMFNKELDPAGNDRPDRYMTPYDLADAVMHVISMQPHVQIEDLILKAV